MCLRTRAILPRGLKEGELNDNSAEKDVEELRKRIEGVATVRTCVRIVQLNQVQHRTAKGDV